MTVVLDSSAVLAVILREPGAERVEAVLDESVLCSVNECEVATKLIRRGASSKTAAGLLAGLTIDLLPLDSRTAHAAAALEPFTRVAGLSLGDRCCLALAADLSAPVLTADRAWARLADAVGIEVRLIR